MSSLTICRFTISGLSRHRRPRKFCLKKDAFLASAETKFSASVECDFSGFLLGTTVRAWRRGSKPSSGSGEKDNFGHRTFTDLLVLTPRLVDADQSRIWRRADREPFTSIRNPEKTAENRPSKIRAGTCRRICVVRIRKQAACVLPVAEAADEWGVQG